MPNIETPDDPPPGRRPAAPAPVMPDPGAPNKGAQVQAMFAEIAPTYDRLNRLLSLRRDQVWRRRTVRAVSPAPTARVLDCACGTGDLTLAFAGALARCARRAGVVPATVIGTDFCAPMLELARQKARRLGRRRRLAPVEFAPADVLNLPFADGAFEVVSIAFGLRNVEDVGGALRELARVLAPGGRLAILEFTTPRGWLGARLYRFYFTHVLPVVGQLVSRSKSQAYRYLPASVEAFADLAGVTARLGEVGLTEVRVRRWNFGAVALFLARRPPVEHLLAP